MNERICASNYTNGCNDPKDAVCIHTDKIYDSCKDKDCIEDARVYFTAADQEVIDRAVNVKCRKSEIIWVFTDVEPVPFNRGYFTVDLKFFFKVDIWIDEVVLYLSEVVVTSTIFQIQVI